MAAVYQCAVRFVAVRHVPFGSQLREPMLESARRRPLQRRSLMTPNRNPSSPAEAARAQRTRRPLVIDFHCHMRVQEVVDFSKGRLPDASIPNLERMSEEARRLDREWAEEHRRRTGELPYRLKLMDEQGVDIQVLSTSIISMCTYWAAPEESLRMERLANERLAEMVSKAPGRFVGLGSVPLQAPELAARELERCMTELGFKGAQISSQAGAMELGDARLRPFWAAAERLGACLFMHPAGVADARFRPYHLWNSIGQPLEEAMGMASLFYEGVLDAFPGLKLCIAHGGGYLPFYAGRVDRNYIEKAFTRVNMTRSPSEYLRDCFWYDTSVYNPDMLEFLVRKVGASRIVMGSDYPSGEDDPVAFVRKAKGLSPEEQEDILGRTAARLLGLAIQ
jgi:aminocarboxymuconate-semialdehyde decarboxylase